jgi:predicted RNA-binding protein with PUA-like domain
MPRRPRHYWLAKSEPNAYSIDDLERDGRTPWDGVRNYQVRNSMRDDMKPGDLVIIYHSSAKPPGAAGIAKVAGKPYPDALQFDKKSKYYDEKSDPDDPTWILVDFEFVEKFRTFVPLPDLKANPRLEGMLVTKRGMRISVMPVEKKHFDAVRKMGK